MEAQRLESTGVLRGSRDTVEGVRQLDKRRILEEAAQPVGGLAPDRATAMALPGAGSCQMEAGLAPVASVFVSVQITDCQLRLRCGASLMRTHAMTLLPPGVKVHLAFGYTDMRKGIDGLAMMVPAVLRHDPFSGRSVTLFRCKQGTARFIMHPLVRFRAAG